MFKLKGLLIPFLILLSLTLFSCGQAEKKKVLYYVNPMNPVVKSDKPMKDSMGMDYIPVYEKKGGQSSQTSGTNKPTAMESTKMNTNVISSVELTPDEEKRVSVQITKVDYRPIDRIIKAVGQINYNEQKWVHVSARIAGRIDKLYINFTGMKVNAGQPLLLLYSPSLVTTEEELLQLYSSYTNALSANDPDSINESKSLYDSSRKKLSLFGITESQITEILKAGQPQINIPILSPITGTVIKMYPTAGMYINEGDMLYEIANLGQVWMEADIYEQDIAMVKMGASVDISTVSYPGRVFKGTISFVNPYLDPVTRTIKIRAAFNNQDEALKPGMYVDAVIKVNMNRTMLAIPQTAVLDTGERKIVYVYLGSGKYEGRSVVLEPKAGEYYPVVSGLKRGEQVVTYGTYLIDSQAQLMGTYNIQYTGE